MMEAHSGSFPVLHLSVLQFFITPCTLFISCSPSRAPLSLCSPPLSLSLALLAQLVQKQPLFLLCPPSFEGMGAEGKNQIGELSKTMGVVGR